MEWLKILVSALSGTILGWILQIIKSNKLIFSDIIIRPKKPDEDIQKSYFMLNVYNSSNNPRAINDPKIILYSKKEIVSEECVQSARTAKNKKELEENENETSYITLIEIPPHGIISTYCRLESEYTMDKITMVQLSYKNEKFKTKNVDIKWDDDFYN